MTRGTALGIAAAASCAVAGIAMSAWAAVVGNVGLVDLVGGQTVIVAFATVGALLVAARPRNGIGWLLAAIGATWALGGGALDVANRGIVEAPGSVPGVAAWALAGSAMRTLAWYLAVLGLTIYFPTGRVASRRWRWLPRAFVVVGVCAVVNGLGAPDGNITYMNGWRNPLAFPPSLGFLDGLSFLGSMPLAVVAGGFAVAQLAGRWRHGGPIERRQLALFVVAAIPPVVAAPIGMVAGGGWIFYAAVLPLPFAVAVAVLRYHLYDLERVVSRTVSYAVLTGLLVGLYVGCVALLTDVAPFSSTLGVAASTLAAVALFAPLRARVQHVVDRRFNRARYDAAATTAAFAARVRDEVDLGAVRADLLAAVAATVQPASVGVWLRGAP